MARSRTLKAALRIGTVIILVLAALIICAQSAWLVERIAEVAVGGAR